MGRAPIGMMAREGKFNGGYAPLGYDIVNREYIINPLEADTVRTIYAMYAAGESYNAILDALPLGMCGKRGRPLGKNSLYEILNNERYIGRYTWNKRKVKYFGEWAGGEASERAVVIEDAIPAIIDRDTWEKVRVRMESNKKNKLNHSRVKRDYLLSGLMRCGHCGSALFGLTTTNKKGYENQKYVCVGKHQKRICKAKNLPAVEIETLVLGLLRQSVLDGKMVEATADAILEAGAKRNKPSDEDFIKKELAEVERRQRNLAEALQNGMQDIGFLHDSARELETKHRLLEQKLVALKPQKTVTREYLVRELSQDIAALKNNPAYIKDLVQKYIVEIIVYDDAIEIYSTADLTMRMVIPEGWTIEHKKAAGNADGLGPCLNTDGCGGRI